MIRETGSPEAAAHSLLARLEALEAEVAAMEQYFAENPLSEEEAAELDAQEGTPDELPTEMPGTEAPEARPGS